METKNAIDVRDLKISYRVLKSFSIKRSLLKLKKSEVEVFEAIKGISFSVPEGEIMGIFSPYSGEIDLHGHSVSLLSIGVGFQKALTGRENIILSGMLLGFSEEQVRAKMDDIIKFAELGRFIDMPVRTYSSGMHSKLAFSITAMLESDIMLIDEVLSVGDVKFRKKSYNKMKQLISNKDRTVIIVSHSSDTLKKLCTSLMWLHEGEIKMIGDTNEVLNAYEEFMAK